MQFTPHTHYLAEYSSVPLNFPLIFWDCWLVVWVPYCCVWWHADNYLSLWSIFTKTRSWCCDLWVFHCWLRILISLMRICAWLFIVTVIVQIKDLGVIREIIRWLVAWSIMLCFVFAEVIYGWLIMFRCRWCVIDLLLDFFSCLKCRIIFAIFSVLNE